MALSASIFKIALQVSDLDRQHYGSYSLTVARHPSETDERMMVRLLAFMQYADERLVFSRGLSETDEPDLWIRSFSGHPELWIEVGMPTVKRIVSGGRKADKIAVFAYGRSAEQWWKKNRDDLEKVRNLELVVLPVSLTEALAKRAERSMQWQCLVQDRQMNLINDGETFELDLENCVRLPLSGRNPLF